MCSLTNPNVRVKKSKENELSERKNIFRCSQLGFSGIQGLSLPPKSNNTLLAQVKFAILQKKKTLAELVKWTLEIRTLQMVTNIWSALRLVLDKTISIRFCLKFFQLLTFEYSFCSKEINVLITVFWNRDKYRDCRWTFISCYHSASKVLKRMEVISI